ncbi:MAG: DUF1800 domain-containing protein [Candidatus Eremiobacteraeota bacterium]|nr:DUF1800 domain-containing protein [Candidatus Eremiobacteraeota bacterium]
MAELLASKLNTTTDPQVGFRPPGTLDAAHALDRYSGPFGPRQAAHLARRSGFGATPAEVATLAGLGVERAVDLRLHPADADLDFPAYPATDELYNQKTAVRAAQMWWLDRMLRTKHPLVEKMTLFWHGHFATSIRKVPAPLMAEQIDLFRAQGLGNFRTLLLNVSQNPAMLVWLDNRFNVKAHPNENYARELMELFALGLGNYTEDDVREAARAFTGWTLDKNLRFTFIPARHDDGTKTFLGRTGNFGGEDIVNIVVSQPISQRFIARKLLEFFVYSDPEPELIESAAAVYAYSGYDIGKTLGTILRSNVFYSSRAYRALPKSPLEFTIGTLRLLQVATVPANSIYLLQRMGQEPLAPPSVKGWDGGPTWINTSTLLSRFNFINQIVNQATAKTDDPMGADKIVAAAGGMNADKILSLLTASAVQDDVPAEIRVSLGDYMQSRTGTNPTPFGPENYAEKIRGALALTLNLPVNQLN